MREQPKDTLHVCMVTSPMDWYGWMKSLVMGFSKIKF